MIALMKDSGNILGHWKFITTSDQTLTCGKPTPIHLPKELGGEMTKIVGMTIGDKGKPPCPACGDPGPVHIIELENRIFVLCCLECQGYSWVRYEER